MLSFGNLVIAAFSKNSLEGQEAGKMQDELAGMLEALSRFPGFCEWIVCLREEKATVEVAADLALSVIFTGSCGCRDSQHVATPKKHQRRHPRHSRYDTPPCWTFPRLPLAFHAYASFLQLNFTGASRTAKSIRIFTLAYMRPHHQVMQSRQSVSGML